MWTIELANDMGMTLDYVVVDSQSEVLDAIANSNWTLADGDIIRIKADEE